MKIEIQFKMVYYNFVCEMHQPLLRTYQMTALMMTGSGQLFADTQNTAEEQLERKLRSGV